MSSEPLTGHSDGTPRHFVVVVPGFMGSKLRDRKSGETVWVDFTTVPHNPLQWHGWLDRVLGTLAYPNDDLEPAGIMDQVIFVPPWAKQEHYGRLFAQLQAMGYRADPTRYPESELDVYAFAYDWRADNRDSALKLGEAIEHWRLNHRGAKAWIIAHSNGGLVARWYIEKEGGKDHVGRLILMGSPWDGAPKAMNVLFSGLDTLFRRRFDLFDIPQRTRDLVRTFPCTYQLLPHKDPFLRTLSNEPVDPFTTTGWLENDDQRNLLTSGRRFNEELGTTASVETLCFFGRKKLTTTFGMLHSAAGDRWSTIDWRATEAGDGTVPEHSAVHPGAKAKLPFTVDHGDIYVNPAVLEILEWELIDQYRLGRERAALASERLMIIFDSDKDVYGPGEPITLRAAVRDNESSSPVSRVRIEVRLLWKRSLPGMEEDASPRTLPKTDLWENEDRPGDYEGSLIAPHTEGYYQLKAAVESLGKPTVVLDELIAIEAVPTS